MTARVPPGPHDYFFGLRTMARLKRDVLGFYGELQRDFGDCVSFRTGPYRLFAFFHPDQVHEVLVAQAKSLIRFPPVMETFAQWNGRSILIAEGDAWIRQRRLVQTAFQPRRMEHYGQLIAACAGRLADRWQGQAVSPAAPPVTIRESLTALTLEIIGRALFDRDLAAESGGISRAVADLSEIAFHEMQAPFRWPSWWPSDFMRRKRRAMQMLDQVVWSIVRERRAEGADHGDLLSTLLTAVDEGQTSGLTDRQVRDEAMTLLLAGHDTSAAALEWLCYLLARHPAIAARCQRELAEQVGNRTPAASDAPRLPYLRAVIQETLRLYPPAIAVFLRQAAREVTLGGYAVPRGGLIALNSFVTQRDERWFPEPLRFNPERFLPAHGDHLPAGAYFPFGGGPRVCIGQNFALLELTLIAAVLLQRLTPELPAGAPEPEPFVHMALRPKTPVALHFRPAAPSG